jgi:hypothetical protein
MIDATILRVGPREPACPGRSPAGSPPCTCNPEASIS